MNKNIIILTGGNSAEKDISLKSAEIIKNNLQNIYNIKTILCEVKNNKLTFQNTKQKSLNFENCCIFEGGDEGVPRVRNF